MKHRYFFPAAVLVILVPIQTTFAIGYDGNIASFIAFNAVIDVAAFWIVYWAARQRRGHERVES